MYARSPIATSKENKVNISTKDTPSTIKLNNSRILSESKVKLCLQQEMRFDHLSWMEALTWIDKGRFSVYQWRKIISKTIHQESDPLEIDVTNFDQMQLDKKISSIT
jgi:hypothetical protein